MNEVIINNWAVLLGTVVSMFLGFMWYGPLFGKEWSKLTKVTQEQMKKGNSVAMIGAVVSSVMLTYVLAHVTYLSYRFFGGSFASAAFRSAFWMWLGFQALVIWQHDAFEQRRRKLTVLNAGYELVRIMAVAAVIAAIGLKASGSV
jgi:hypothetical protein